MIEAVDLCKTFGTGLAVDHLTLTIQAGEVFCLLGANGAGKTTTINLFLNFIPPTSGHARIGGLDVVAHPVETKKRLAYIPEQVTLYRNLTGLENLRFFSRLAQASADSDDELLATLAQVGLTAEQARRIGSMMPQAVSTSSRRMNRVASPATASSRPRSPEVSHWGLGTGGISRPAGSCLPGRAARPP